MIELAVKTKSVFWKMIEPVIIDPVTSAAAAVVAWFAGTGETLLVMLLAVMLDFITGIIKAWRLKEKVTSHRMRDTVIKLFLYCSTYLLVFAIAKATLWDVPLANVAASLILLTEAASVCENVDAITGGKLGLAAMLKRIRAKRMKNLENGLFVDEVEKRKNEEKQ